jgi:preprotein translocase subunit SecE
MSVAKEEKESKSLVKEKPNFWQRMVERTRRYIAETSGELRKVNWPTRREAGYLTVVVLVVTSIMAIILGTADWVFSKIFEWILTLPV